MSWHQFFVHDYKWIPFLGGGGGGVIAHYRAVDGRVHMALFCDECGQMFDKDKPPVAGTLADALVEPHQLRNLCTRMTRRGGAAEIEQCMRANGWHELAPKA